MRYLFFSRRKLGVDSQLVADFMIQHIVALNGNLLFKTVNYLYIPY